MFILVIVCLRWRRGDGPPATPAAPLLDGTPGPIVSTPLGQENRSPSNDLLFPDPSVRLDFERIELEVLGDEGPGDEFDSCRVEIGDFGDEESEFREELEDEEEEGKSDDGGGSVSGQPQRLRRSDRANKGIPPVRFPAGP